MKFINPTLTDRIVLGCLLRDSGDYQTAKWVLNLAHETTDLDWDSFMQLVEQVRSCPDYEDLKFRVNNFQSVN